MRPDELRGHGRGLISQPGGIAGVSGLDQILGRGNIEIGADESLDESRVAVPLITPVIVSWPELESVRLPSGPRLILPETWIAPAPVKAYSPDPGK